MTRARIFISHSCKDVEIADDVPFEDETDPRKQRLKYARHIRDEVKRLLETTSMCCSTESCSTPATAGQSS
ncbi:MAG: hypothetical protein R3E45_05080 [Rhodocyclaceae bacterium]